MNSLEEYFNIIVHGNKDDSRLAARKVRKLLYSSQLSRDTYNDIKTIINSAPSGYTQILEEWRQENFVVAISVIYFMHDKEEQPDFLFPWLFHLLHHPNGALVLR